MSAMKRSIINFLTSLLRVALYQDIIQQDLSFATESTWHEPNICLTLNHFSTSEFVQINSFYL